jgi:hypothetical protein
VVSQPADSGIRLAAIVSTAGISLPLQCKRIIIMVHNFRYQSIVGSLLPLQITKPVSSVKCGKIITYGFEWAFRYQLFAACAPLNWISHIFLLKPLKLFFCDLKSKFPLILKIKYQRFNGNERPLD